MEEVLRILSFILTMRNVNRKHYQHVGQQLRGFILTMRNVNLNIEPQLVQHKSVLY